MVKEVKKRMRYIAEDMITVIINMILWVVIFTVKKVVDSPENKKGQQSGMDNQETQISPFNDEIRCMPLACHYLFEV